ncbi:unnamed protein product [Closterium sp. NIES-53]
MAAQELRWLTYLLTDLGEQPRSPPVLYVDNKAMISLCKEHRLEDRTRNIALRYVLTRELQQCGQLRLAYVATRANTADILTNALPPGDHQRFSTVLGLLALLFLTGLVTTFSTLGSLTEVPRFPPLPSLSFPLPPLVPHIRLPHCPDVRPHLPSSQSRPVVGGPVTERAGSGGATSRDAGHGGAGSGVANVGVATAVSALAASDDSACDCASPFLPLNWLPSSPLLTVSPGFRSLASSLGTSPARFPPSLPQSPPLLPDPSLASSPWASRPPRAQPPKSSL